MIDCHCHLADNDFDEDISSVVERAKAAGVRACLVNTERTVEWPRVVQLRRMFGEFVASCVGVHPVQWDDQQDGGRLYRSVCAPDLQHLENILSQNVQSIIALGETGLDFTPRYIHDKDKDKEGQRDALGKHIELGRKYDLPLICHSRSSGKPVIEYLLQNGATRVLLHAFDGNAKSAKPGIEAGFYFSIPPSSIHSDQKKSLIKAVPLEQLMLETDSPVLGPDKEKRNEPANITYSAKLISDLKGITVDEVVQITTANALRLFPKLKLLCKV